MNHTGKLIVCWQTVKKNRGHMLQNSCYASLLEFSCSIGKVENATNEFLWDDKLCMPFTKAGDL